MVATTRLGIETPAAMEPQPRSSTKKVVLALVLLVALGCLISGGVVVVLVGAFSFSELGGDESWSTAAIAERDVPTVFGCRFPDAPVIFQSRAFGFQDGYYELLVKLPRGGGPTFVSANGLTVGAPVPASADLNALVESFEPGTGPLTSRPLDVPAPTPFADGGVWVLHRKGELLETKSGEVWVHLTAFET